MTFPSKILLFGEYSLVTGGSGLAIPYQRYTGQLRYAGSSNTEKSNHSISQLIHFFKTRKTCCIDLDYKQLIADLSQGLWFDSTIPVGYGLGSSGALVAALYEKYRLQPEVKLEQLKTDLASMESFFHGSSSGVDPLVALLKKPLVAKKDKVTVLDDWSLKQLGVTVYLIDTGEKSKTISLVDWFKAKMKQDRFSEATMNNYVLPGNSVIDQIESGKKLNFNVIQTLSRYQIDYLSPMVTSGFRKHFIAGLEGDEFVFKLCGSGGGGFMMCLAKDEEAAESYFLKNVFAYEKVI